MNMFIIMNIACFSPPFNPDVGGGAGRKPQPPPAIAENGRRSAFFACIAGWAH